MLMFRHVSWELDLVCCCWICSIKYNCPNRACHLAVFAGNIILVAWLIWRSGTRRRNLRVPHFQWVVMNWVKAGCQNNSLGNGRQGNVLYELKHVCEEMVYGFLLWGEIWGVGWSGWYCSRWDISYTVKPVYNDHLMGYFSAFWSSSRWSRAT